MKGTGCPERPSPGSSPPAGVCPSPFTPPSPSPSLFPGLLPSSTWEVAGALPPRAPHLRFSRTSTPETGSSRPSSRPFPSPLCCGSPEPLCNGAHHGLPPPSGAPGGSPRVWRSEVGSRQKNPAGSLRWPGDRRPRPPPAPPCLLREDGLGPDATSASRRVERGAERAAAGRPSLKGEKDRGSAGSP